MAYSKNNLASGSILTKTALDNMENGIAAAAERPTSGTPSSSTYFRGDGVWATPPTGGGSGGSVNGVVYADSPPAGLSAVAANGTTNDSSTLQSHLNYIKTTWGGGTLVLPFAKTMVISSGLNVPSGVRIVGDATSVLKYTATSGAAININDGSCVPLRGFKLVGPASGGGKNVTGAGTSTGISVIGARMDFLDLEIRFFNRGIDIVHDDTYILSWSRCRIGNNVMCVWADIAGASGSTLANNSGERIVFNECLFDNSTQLFYFSANGPTMYFIGCSIDFTSHYGKIDNAFVHFIGCHLEAGDGVLSNNWMFELNGNPKLLLSDCDIIMGATHHLTSPNGPYNSDIGRVRVHHTSFYNVNPSGSGQSTSSEDVVFINGSTGSPVSSISLYSPYVSSWSATSARFIAQNAIAQPNSNAIISAMNPTAGTFTVTFSPAITTAAFLGVDY